LVYFYYRQIVADLPQENHPIFNYCRDIAYQFTSDTYAGAKIPMEVTALT